MIGHSLLKRQLSKLQLDTAVPPTPEQWAKFLETVDRTYQTADEERYTSERSAELASQEMRELYDQLAAESDRVRAIIASLSDALIQVDARGFVAFVNPSAEFLLKKSSEDLHKGSLLDVCSLVDELAQPIGLDAVHRDDVRLLIGDGTSVAVSLTVTPLRQGSGSLVVLRDLTERRAAEMELRAALVAAEVASQSERAKDDFLATMSHELRTPLNAIIGYAELLSEDLADSGNPLLVQDCEKIRNAGRHLLALINNVLDLSKVAAGRMDIFVERFQLQALIEDVVNTVQPLVAKNHSEIVVNLDDGRRHIEADVTKVRQCLYNLLSNAAKFTENGRITFDIRCDDDEIAFSVTDTGIGITPEQQLRLFQPFVQADASTTRHYGGTGLGLVLSRQFAELMGGRISVVSEAGVGSTFTFYLPLAVVPGPAPLPVGDRPLVLVIDDDPVARDLITRALERDGLAVISGSTGEEGLRFAREMQPAAITLDVLMPGMDGWTVLGALKADPETAAIPVVLVSAVNDRSHAFSLGASDFVNKPVERPRLMAALRRYTTTPWTAPVLVVEDDDFTRETVRRMLERENIPVLEAANGKLALERIAERRPALILLDVMMPEMDGFGFMSQLGRNPDLATIPVVVMTALDLSKEDRARLGASVEHVLRKGRTTPEELVREVRRHATR